MPSSHSSAYVERLCAIDKAIVMAVNGEGPTSLTGTQIADLLWEAADLCSAITIQLCATDKVWLQLDLLGFSWRRLFQLATMARNYGVLELPLERMATQAFEDTEMMFTASELVDGCQIDLLAQHEDERVRENLLLSVNVLAETADRWFVHGLLGRSEAYFNAGHALLMAVEQRCIKERSALIAR